MRGKCKGLCHICRNGSAIQNITDCRGGGGRPCFYQLAVPQCGAFNRYLLDVLKVKAPPLPGAGGMVINDKLMCINVFKCKLVYGSPVYTYGTISHELY